MSALIYSSHPKGPFTKKTIAGRARTNPWEGFTEVDPSPVRIPAPKGVPK